MARVDNVLDDRQRSQGDHVSAIHPIPVGTTRYRARIHRGLFPNAWPTRPGTGQASVVVQLQVRISQDLGVNWLPWGEVGTGGGEILGRAGVMQFTTIHCWIPNENNPDRVMQARLRTRRNNIRARVDIDLDDTPRPPTTRQTGNSVGFNTGEDAYTAVSTTSTTPSFTPSGTGRYLVGFGLNYHLSAPAAYTSISSSVDGNLTQDSTFVHNIYMRQSSAVLANPSTSSMTVTYTAASTENNMYAGAMSFTGVASIDSWTQQNGTGNNPARPHTSETGDMVIQFLGIDAATIAVAGDGVSRFETEGQGGDNYSFGLSTGVGASTVDMNWTATTGPYGWGMLTANLNAGATGPPDLLTYLKHRTNVLLRM